jgi:PAS domain S-box-containing protein
MRAVIRYVPQRWLRQETIPLWPRVFLFTVAYFGSAWLGKILSVSGTTNVNFWLPAGVYLAALLLNPRPHWPWIALSALVANFAFDFLQGTRPAAMIPFFWGANTLQAMLGAWLLQRFIARHITLTTLKEFAGLIGIAGLGTTALGAALAAATLVQFGASDSFQESWLIWWGSCAMPVLVLTPFLLVWCSMPGRKQIVTVPARRIPEALVLFLVLVFAVSYMVSQDGVMTPYKICLVPVLLYAGTRFGLHGATGATVLASLMIAYYNARHGASPTLLQLVGSDREAMVLQSTLATISLVSIIPAIVLGERTRAEQALRRQTELLRTIVEDQTEMIMRWKPDGTLTFVNTAYCRAFGGTPESLVGNNFLPRLPGALREALLDRMHALSPDNPVVTSLDRYPQNGGELRWQEWTERGIFDDGGGLVEVQSTGRDVTKRQQTEELIKIQREVLEMIASGKPMPETLATLLRMVESQSPDIVCSILLLDADGVHMRHAAGPSLPAEYIRAIDGSVIGPNAGSCGTAAYRGEPVFVADIASDPLWADYKQLALPHGLRACWSTPIFSTERKVLGTFAIYHRKPELPRNEFVELITAATHTAAICIVKHQADAALRDSEERFSKAFHSSPDAVVISDLGTGRCIDANESFYRLFGLTREETIGRTSVELGLWRDVEERTAVARTLAARGSLRDIERTSTNRRGEPFTVMVNADLFELAGQPTVVTTLHDITVQRQVEATLRAAQAEELRVREEFARRLITAQENERHRLAVELHDSLGQNLSVIKNRVHMASQVGALPADAAGHLEAIDRVVTTAIAETRSLAHNLRPPHIEQVGLTESLRALIVEMSEATSIHFERRLENVDDVFQGAVATHFFRIMQEALNNLVKHSQATEASVTLERDVHRVRLLIADDGVGFDRAVVEQQRGLGLTSMHERVRMLGGTLHLESQPGQGTRLTVEVPIPDVVPEAGPADSAL